MVPSQAPSPNWTCTIDHPRSPRWTCTTFHVNVVRLHVPQRTQCQVAQRLISMLRIHTACGTQQTLPAARVWCTRFGTEHPYN